MIKWTPRRRIEKEYQRWIIKLFNRFHWDADMLHNPESLKNAIQDFVASQTFYNVAEKMARQMVTMTNRHVDRSWREAARKSSKGNKIYRSLRHTPSTYQELIDRNVHYIQSAPPDIAENMARTIFKMQQQGIRPEGIAKELQKKYPHMKKTKAMLIARTESSRASAILMQSKAKSAGVTWYEWRTAEDARVRDSHSHMDRVLCSYISPPSPEKLIGKKSYGNYNPGETYNCRCYAAPLISIDDVHWPHKVYYGGHIQKMTRYQFKELL
ncbi:phage minor head protein [Megasphaera cerevisiae]|uniref:phage head morphogenesis protein n=1 Tax=Megasphaera cerevisiae TaxID=39029 RepID=UPI00065AE787|nr:phage minor head protein [Megasphaera cerevisiae]SJZ58930.1 phage putative head morphogenesis protein, SPP1 gp7 family [Megasphaera cerevisiae DSM 20462]